jgi:hypothetical protein
MRTRDGIGENKNDFAITLFIPIFSRQSLHFEGQVHHMLQVIGMHWVQCKGVSKDYLWRGGWLIYFVLLHLNYFYY